MVTDEPVVNLNNTSEVRLLVQDEGKAARNLIAFNVPVDDLTAIEHSKSSARKPPTSPKPHGSLARFDSTGTLKLDSSNTLRKRTRVRSVSAGREKRSTLQSRYWAFLFDNLQRAIDEIYTTCEQEESIPACREAVMVLENYVRDLNSLTDWLRLNREYENTPALQRPNSLTWEIRKSTPLGIPYLDAFEKKCSLAMKKQSESKSEITILKVVNEVSPPKEISSEIIEESENVNKEDEKKDPMEEKEDNMKDIKEDEMEAEKNDAMKEDIKLIPGLENEKKSQTCKEIIEKINTEEFSKKKKDETMSKEKDTLISEVLVQNSTCSSSDETKTDVSPRGREKSSDTKDCGTCTVSVRDVGVFVNPAIRSQQTQTFNKESEEIRTDMLVIESCLKLQTTDKGTDNCDSNLQRVSITTYEQNENIVESLSDEGSPIRKVDVSIQTDYDGSLEIWDGILEHGENYVAPEKRDNFCQTPPDDVILGEDIEETKPVVKSTDTPKVPSVTKATTFASKVSATRGTTQPRVTTQPLKPAWNSVPKTKSYSTLQRQSIGSRTMNTSTMTTTAPRPTTVPSRTGPPNMPRTYPPLKQYRSAGRGLTTAPQNSYSYRRGGYINTSNRPHGLMAAPAQETRNALDTRSNSNSSLSSSASSVRSWIRTTGSDDTLKEKKSDPDGWETVRGRSRAKNSPVNRILEQTSFHSQSAGDLVDLPAKPESKLDEVLLKKETKSTVMSRIRSTFGGNKPKAAVSLPSLSLSASEKSKAKKSILTRTCSSATSSADNRNQKKFTSKENIEPKLKKSLSSEKVQKIGITNCMKKKNQDKEIKAKNLQNKSSTKCLPSSDIIANETPQEKKSVIDITKLEVIEIKAEEVTEEVNVTVEESVDTDFKTKAITVVDTSEIQRITATNKTITNSVTDISDVDTDIQLLDIIDHNEAGPSLCCSLTEDSLRKHNEANGSEDEYIEIEKQDGTISPSGCTTITTRDDESVKEEEEIKQKEEALQSAMKEEESLEKEIKETEESTGDFDPESDPDSESKTVSGESIEEQYEKELEGLSWGDQMDAIDKLKESADNAIRYPGRALHLHEKLLSPARKRSTAETKQLSEEKQAQAAKRRVNLQDLRSQKLSMLFEKIKLVRERKQQLVDQKRELLDRKMKRADEKRQVYLQEIVKKAHDEEEKLKEIAFINEMEAQNKRHDFFAQCQEQEVRWQSKQEERLRKAEETAAKKAQFSERKKKIENEREHKINEYRERISKKAERVDREQQVKEKERLELAKEKQRDRDERLSALHAAQIATQEEQKKKLQLKQEESARRHEEAIEQIRQKASELSVLRHTVATSNREDNAPRSAPFATLKMCLLCNVLIGSELYLLSHLRGKQHQEALRKQEPSNESTQSTISKEDSVCAEALYGLSHIEDAPIDNIDPRIAMDRERQKALKKRCKKLRQRMVSKAEEYEKKVNRVHVDSPNMLKLQRCVKDLQKQLSAQGKGPWPNAALLGLERSLGEINRTLEKKNPNDQLAFQTVGGFGMLSHLLRLTLECLAQDVSFISTKCVLTAINTYTLACKNHQVNANYVLSSHSLAIVLDLLIWQLNILIPDTSRFHCISPLSDATGLPVDSIASSLLQLLALLMMHVSDADSVTTFNTSKNNVSKSMASPEMKEEFLYRVKDAVSYTVSMGIVDKVSVYLSGVRGCVDDEPEVANFLLTCLQLLTALSDSLIPLKGNNQMRRDDPTQLIATLQVTDLGGVLSMLYGLLLPQGGPARSSPAPPPEPLPIQSCLVATETMKMLNKTARLDITMYQSVIGAEGISLQFRHIASYLLWQCAPHNTLKEHQQLLHQVITSVGFFTVHNQENQSMIHSGHQPTVLQQLCTLPFEYFSSPPLSKLLYPTLLACCYDNPENKIILQNDVSYKALLDFMKSEDGKSNFIIQIIASRQ